MKWKFLKMDYTCCFESVVTTVLFSVLITTTACADGIDVYIEACRRHGRNSQLLYTGTANFQTMITEYSAGKVVNTNKYNDKVVFNGNDPGHGKRLFIRHNRSSHGTFAYVSDTTPVAEVESIYTLENSQQPPTFVVSHTKFEVPEFMKFGRIQGDEAWMTIIALLDFSNPKDYKFIEDSVSFFKKNLTQMNAENTTQPFVFERTEKYDSGNGVASVIVNKTEKGATISEYWIDIQRGYICPIVRIYDVTSGSLVEEYISSEFFLDEKTLLWFPQKYVEKQYEEQTGNLLLSSEFVVDRKTFQLNATIDDKCFSISIPKGSVVLDDRKTHITDRYVASEEGLLVPIIGKTNLKDVSWLTFEYDFPSVRYVGEKNDNTKSQSVSSGTIEAVGRVSLFVIGLIMIIWAFSRRKNSKQT